MNRTIYVQKPLLIALSLLTRENELKINAYEKVTNKSPSFNLRIIILSPKKDKDKIIYA